MHIGLSYNSTFYMCFSSTVEKYGISIFSIFSSMFHKNCAKMRIQLGFTGHITRSKSIVMRIITCNKKLSLKKLNDERIFHDLIYLRKLIIIIISFLLRSFFVFFFYIECNNNSTTYAFNYNLSISFYGIFFLLIYFNFPYFYNSACP